MTARSDADQGTDDGARRYIEGRYVLTHQHLTFSLGDYDRGRELIIDPAFVYSTYLGGSSFDSATAIAVDSQDAAGNIYVTGVTYSTDFPTVMAFQNTNKSGATSFVTKISMPHAAAVGAAVAPPAGATSSGGGAVGWGLVGVLGLAAAARARRKMGRC